MNHNLITVGIIMNDIELLMCIHKVTIISYLMNKCVNNIKNI